MINSKNIGIVSRGEEFPILGKVITIGLFFDSTDLVITSGDVFENTSLTIREALQQGVFKNCVYYELDGGNGTWSCDVTVPWGATETFFEMYDVGTGNIIDIDLKIADLLTAAQSLIANNAIMIAVGGK